MSDGEIIAQIVAFVVIGAFLITGSVVLGLRRGDLFSVAWSAFGILLVATLLARSIPQAVIELRRRKANEQNRKHETSA
jgi:hypothetical protein